MLRVLKCAAPRDWFGAGLRPHVRQTDMPDVLLLIVQVSVVLMAARFAGFVLRRMGQPQVVGEMLAGVMLGPSLLGWLAPQLSERLFPPTSLGYLNSLSQFGLLIFMFLVGLELDPRLVRRAWRTALITSHASIVAPFVLGSGLAIYLYPRFSDASVSFTSFAMFIGTAMSVTAFPVLARILSERGLLTTHVGAVAIACAAVNDVTAWCILAGVVGFVRAAETELPLWVTVVALSVHLCVMAYGVRPLMRSLTGAHGGGGRLSQDLLTIIFLVILGSAFVTEWLGIHALFGAFVAGVVMPKDTMFVHVLTEKLQDVTVVLFLPLFFAFTGLRTGIGLVSTPEMGATCLLIIVTAIVGKLGGSAIAARAGGMSWRGAGALGVMVNTRGMMELVVLNIGLDLGVLSPVLFTMMVVMTLVTTLMTSPLLAWMYPLGLIEQERCDAKRELEAEPSRACGHPGSWDIPNCETGRGSRLPSAGPSTHPQ